ncbi:hypothetical protein RhiJN_11886 [Ceratobasidium sp. AG-Ba]|nr:hypothetical protein RhiJN_11886 [Ceratobasidium sp. AG-Ba]
MASWMPSTPVTRQRFTGYSGPLGGVGAAPSGSNPPPAPPTLQFSANTGGQGPPNPPNNSGQVPNIPQAPLRGQAGIGGAAGGGQGPPGPPGPPGPLGPPNPPGGAVFYQGPPGPPDLRLKYQDVVPEWDGNPDTLARWFKDLEKLAARSQEIARAIPEIVHLRFTKEAKQWWESFPANEQIAYMRNWQQFKEDLGNFFWTPAWTSKAKSKAHEAKYRDSGHHKETPVQYALRKKELIDAAYRWPDRDVIGEIARGAPHQWKQIVDHDYIGQWSSYLALLKEKEDMLEDWPNGSRSAHTAVSTNDIRKAIKDYKKERKDKRRSKARVNAVNSSPPKTFKKYLYTKDDKNVSATGSTPLKKGLRGCRHCGSKMHFDKECKQPSRFPNIKPVTTKVHFTTSDGHEVTDIDFQSDHGLETIYEEPAYQHETEQEVESEPEEDSDSDSSDSDF